MSKTILVNKIKNRDHRTAASDKCQKFYRDIQGWVWMVCSQC